MNKQLVSSVVKFAIVGGTATLFNYAIFYILQKQFQVNTILATIIGYASGLVLGFFLNNFWTFKSRPYSLSLVLGYATVYLISLGLSVIFMKITVDRLHFNKWVMYIFAIGISTVFNFVGLKTVIYKNEPAGNV
ncbi:GtrA family protein [Mucilaginibacter sp.]